MKAAPSRAERSTQAMALDPARTVAEARQLTGIARTAVRDAGQAFPHSARIAAGFGRYAPHGLRALIGGAAAIAGDALHADAFVLGGRAGFVRTPNVRLAAHEAAHAVAQAHGVAPRGGVGAPGDAGERLADAVADRVAAGGSAEALFAGTLGDGGGGGGGAARPALQMYNRLDPAKTVAPAHDTPWKEIADQLGIAPIDVVSKMTQANAAFGTMAKQLKDNCPRAEAVEADIDGYRKGGPRSGDPIQTAFGTLGTFMEFITGTPQATSIHSYFEGGHLVSDEILGDDSYVAANFAPQRRQINSPAYRKIEEIAAGGVIGRKFMTKAAPLRTMQVKLSYLGHPVTIKTADVLKRLGHPKATKTPTDVHLTQRVPYKWQAAIDTNDDDFAWWHQSTVDSTALSGAAIGWRQKESDLDPIAADTENFIDATAWAMDSMTKAVPGSPNSFGTGGVVGITDQRERKHSFTGVQAVPAGQAATKYGASTMVVTPPLAPPSYILNKPRFFHELGEGDLTGGSTLVKKRRNDFATTILQQNPTWKHTKANITKVVARIEYAKKLKRLGKKPTLGDQLARLIASGSDAKKKRILAEIADVLFNQMIDTAGSKPF